MEKLQQLEESIQRLEQRIKALEDKLGEKEPTTESWRERLTRGPDLEKLNKIRLPDNPTKEQVREYVRNIDEATRGQHFFSTDDPQVRMLAAVGSDNVDVLLESLDGAFGFDNFYTMEVLRQLVGPEHKGLILRHLPWKQGLVTLVLGQGWVDDARETLLKGLRTRPRHLLGEWIQAVAQFKDPKTYEDLKWYLIHGHDPESTYEVIKDLPGLDLKETVENAWDVKKLSGEYEAYQMAKVAVRFGNVEALAEIVRMAAERARDDWEAAEARRLVWRLTGYAGSGKELMEWFQTNKDKLVFNPETGTFSVKAAEEGNTDRK